MSSVGIELEGAWKMPQSKAEYGFILGLSSVGSMAHFLMKFGSKLAPVDLSAISQTSYIPPSYSFELLFCMRFQ